MISSINYHGKKLTNYLFIFSFLINFNAIACDICGCFMGITPYDNQSQISFFHRYRIFSGYRNYSQKGTFFPKGAYRMMHGGTSHVMDTVLKNYSTKDYESYKVYELRAKYFIHPRLELNAIVAVNNNKSREDNHVLNHTGFSDPTFFIGYHALKKVDMEDVQQRLILGAGVKLPSGNYYAKSESGERLPFLMQPGTGSTDGFFYGNYIVGYKKLGLSLNSVFKLNGSNFYNERIANSTSNYLNLFCKIKINNWVLIPSIQSYYEYTKGLYINHELQAGTSMNCLLVGPGIELFYNNLSFTTAFQMNAYERNTANNLSNKGRLIIGLTYNFNQRNYLFNSKTKN